MKASNRIPSRLLACLMLCAPALAPADDRVALVIGNAHYHHAGVLRNPLNDARALAAKLERELGFRVTLEENLTLAGLRESVQRFGRSADRASVALVYFAGHGLEVDGENYLLPVDVRLQHERDVPLEGLGLNALLAQIEGAREYRLVLIDACRDNPLAARMQRRDGTRSAFRGLARVEPHGRDYIAYATRHGTVALDGDGRHSPFAEALLTHMSEPGLSLERLFGRVSHTVEQRTGGRQLPYLYARPSPEPFYLVPPEAVTVPDRPQPEKPASVDAYAHLAGPSFDCAAARQPVELLLCDDRTLARIDGMMGVLYRQLRQRMSDADRQMLRREQLAWIRARDATCPVTVRDLGPGPARDETVACLQHMTQRRVDQLQAVVERTP